MKFAKGIAAQLLRRLDMPAIGGSLMRELARVKFAPNASAKVVEAYVRTRPECASFLDPAAVAAGGLASTEGMLYPQAREWRFSFFRREVGDREARSIRGLVLSESRVALAARIFRLLAKHGDTGALRAVLPDFQADEFEAIFDPDAPRRRWSDPAEPGIYRREHASVMIQSEAARLVIDPLCMSPIVPFATSVIPDERVDAVLITHSHGDHWHIPSVLASVATAETPVLVPHVPKTTLLCTDLAAELRAIGQMCLHPQWGATIRFSDIEIDVLPFYGEQPAVDARCPDSDVRNWGNCYRVNTPQFSAFVLADSGEDPAGNMEDVIAESIAARGPVDAVLACMRDFLSPFEIGGLNHYWMTLPFIELERLYALYEKHALPTSTAGLNAGGIARLCRVARARMFLPYAQGFDGVGKPISAGQWGPSPTLSESDAMGELAKQLAAAGTSTVAQTWDPGDGVVFRCGTLEHTPSDHHHRRPDVLNVAGSRKPVVATAPSE